MLNISDNRECCGCGICAQVCAQNAISMAKDNMGFPYPVIDEVKCNNCGLCEKKCLFRKKEVPENPGQQYFAARHKDNDVLMASRSGGAFSALSDVVLDNGGVVYGASFTDDFSVIHTRATTKEQRDRFRGSKYIQSNMESCIKSVRQDLKNGLTVLFSGTSCQCDALRHYLSSCENLILADVLCHGVASPAVWKAYLADEKKDILTVDFRDKEHFGWKEHKESIYFKDGSRKSRKTFTDLYYKHIIHRPSCAVCPFNSLKRVSDITMADFWGWEKTDPSMNADDKGYSLLLVNSDKGAKLLQQASKELILKKVDIRSCMQRPLVSKLEPNPHCHEFEKDFLERGIGYVERKYGNKNLHSQLRYLYKKTRKLARKVILNK